jgi:hypothetical protein
MRRLLFCLTLFGLLIASTLGAYRIIEVPPVQAGGILLVQQGVPVAAPTGLCSACSGVAGADLACEDAGGTGDTWCTWSDVGTAPITYKVTRPGTLGCTNKSATTAFRLNFTDTGTARYIQHDIGSAKNNAFIQFYYYQDSETDGDDGQRTLLSASSATPFSYGTNQSWVIGIRHNVGANTNYIHLNYVTTFGDPTFFDTDAVLARDTWYRIAVNLTRGSAPVIYVNSTSYTSTNGVYYATSTYRYIQVGSTTLHAQRLDGYIDLLQIDDTTMPSACPE